MQDYIVIPAIQSKLKLSAGRIVYLYGATGFGKTAAVEYFFRRKKHLIIKGHPGLYQELPDLADLKDDVIVIDDLQWVTDEKSRSYINDLCLRGGRQIVLIGRGPLPSWLLQTDLKMNFFQCSERDLLFTEKEIKELFEKSGVNLTKAEAVRIRDYSQGNAVTLKVLLRHMESGEAFDDRLTEAVRMEMFQYSESAFWEEWDSEMQEVLIAMCGYPSFTTEMAGRITLKRNIAEILENARTIGSFLIKYEDGTWEMRMFLRRFLLWKQSCIYSREDYQANYREAARYYEIQGQVEQALEYYEKAGDTHKVSRMLLQNAEKHAGTGHFFETRRFYMALPEEEIKNSAVLMSGMSMLYSIMMMPEESEYWYRELVTYSKGKYISKAERREAKARIAYLDIALPHRGIHGIIGIMKNVAVMTMNKEIKPPEFSVTSNLPSLMNGGLDFCEWSRIDRELAVIMKKPVETVLGTYGKGLVNIALAESGFEKGTMSDYEVMTRLNTGSMMADAGGKIEMCFAASGILIKQHLFRGQIAVARSTLDSIRRKAEIEGADQLFQNMDALSVWLSLMQGDREAAEKWLIQAPDEKCAFCILDRYRYMQKIRCLMALSRYEEAAGLIERMNLYFTDYERNYHWIENQLLKAILFYRTGNGDWQEVLAGALKKCEYFHLTKVIAQEGNAIKSLLDKWENQDKVQNKPVVGSLFLEEIREETARMAYFYPDYLKTEAVDPEILTAKETEILKLLCRGASSEEICAKCGITYNSLKFHNKNIYKKLGVKNRQEAERKAVLLKF